MIEINSKLKINIPIVLGPMAGISDMPFRTICKEMGAGLVFTEMVSAKGLTYKNKNTKALLATCESERPIGLQLFGNEPDIMKEAVQMVEDYPFDLIDINMGCPVPKVVNNHEGSAMMLDIKNAEDVVKAMASATKKPISVKFRKGFRNGEELGIEHAKRMEAAGASLITIHGRTKEQGYSGKADWDHIKKVKESVKIPVVGSGDAFNLDSIVNMFEYTGANGVMVARGARGNPWIFREAKSFFDYLEQSDLDFEILKREKKLSEYLEKFKETREYIEDKISWTDKKEMMLRHAGALIDFYGEYSGIRKMRSHVAWYTAGEKNSAKLRGALSGVCSQSELLDLLKRNDSNSTISLA